MLRRACTLALVACLVIGSAAQASEDGGQGRGPPSNGGGPKEAQGQDTQSSPQTQLSQFDKSKIPREAVRCGDEGILCTCSEEEEEPGGSEGPWLGGSCDVSAILWRGKGWRGPLPDWLAGLQGLETLDLADNELTGTLPGWLAGLPQLVVVDLGRNNFTGPVPDRWFKPGTFPQLSDGTFPQLSELILRNNSLSGTVPATWVNGLRGTAATFPELMLLDLGHNLFTGSVPPTRGFAGLESLGLDHCRLGGRLPPDFLEGGGVGVITLNGNQLEGPLPARWAADDAANPSLTQLMLDGNRLFGQLPVEWANFQQLSVLTLHNNDFTGSVPVEWAQSWGLRSAATLEVPGEGRAEPLPPVQVVVWPGNPRMCGPAWTTQVQAGSWVPLPPSGGAGTDVVPSFTAEIKFTAAIFTEQASFVASTVTTVLSDAVGMNTTRGGSCLRNPECVMEPNLRVTNTFGTCAAMCSPPGNTTVETNLFDLSWKERIGLLPLLRVNTGPDRAGISNMPGQVVYTPCAPQGQEWQQPKDPPYLGGDVAYRGAAMSSQAVLSHEQLLRVASVVSWPPGSGVLWDGYTADPLAEGQDPAGSTPFWVVDLTISLEVAVVLVLPSGPMTKIDVYVGENATSVLSNTLCLSGVDFARTDYTALLMPPECFGRYVVLYGNVALADVQVYPTVADAALHKPVMISTGGASSEDAGSLLTDSELGSCEDWSLSLDDASDVMDDGAEGVLAGASVSAVLDLQYVGMVAAITLFSDQPATNLALSLTNDSSLATPLRALCVLNVTEVSDLQKGEGRPEGQGQLGRGGREQFGQGRPGRLEAAQVLPGQLRQREPLPTNSTRLFGGACVAMEWARYVVVTAQGGGDGGGDEYDSEGGLKVPSLRACGVGVYLAEPPRREQEPSDDDDHSSSGSSVGIIVGATVGGLLGLAALASCLACGVSYGRWRRSQRHHSKLAAQLASAARSSSSAGGSKDGLVAAATLEAMAREAHKSELQLISTFVGMKLRGVHDSVGSACCAAWCCGAPGGSGSGSGGKDGTSTFSSTRLLLPLYYLSGRKRRGVAAAMANGSGADILGSNPSSLQTSGSSGGALGRQGTGHDSELGKAEEELEGSEELPTSTNPPGAIQMSTRYSSQALGGLVDYSDITFGKYLGDGSFGSVHLARWKHVQVAVKVLQRIDPKLLHDASGLGSKVTRSGIIAEQALQELAKEASIMATLRHPCIVSYIGACLDPPCLVMEYCAQGSVYGVLSGASVDPAAAAALTWPRLLRFCLDAAKGMLYLHTLRPPIVHRDLKSANLLVDANWHVKVSDFNLSRVMEPASVVSTLSTANPRWMAPEVIRGQAPSLAADVFSFAVVLWEVMTWELPWHASMNPFQIANCVTAGQRLEVPPRDKLPAGELVVYEEYCDLMAACWDADPHKRPTFDAVVESLQDLATRVVQQARVARGVARPASD